MSNLTHISNPFKDIFLIENFLSTDEIKFLNDFCKSANEDMWNLRYLKDRRKEALLKNSEDSDDFKNEINNRNIFWDDKILEIPDNYNDIKVSIWNKINLFFRGKYKVPEVDTIQRQYSGSNLKVHHDNGYKKNLERAIVIYLNDDYSDGELFFPDYDLEFRPKAGSMITFPGTEDYMHGVKDVGDGPTRYVISVFAYTK